ncbi:hypothetical protein JCM1840_004053 [Sporobolomyces johnsonii]
MSNLDPAHPNPSTSSAQAAPAPSTSRPGSTKDTPLSSLPSISLDLPSISQTLDSPSHSGDPHDSDGDSRASSPGLPSFAFDFPRLPPSPPHLGLSLPSPEFGKSMIDLLGVGVGVGVEGSSGGGGERRPRTRSRLSLAPGDEAPGGGGGVAAARTRRLTILSMHDGLAGGERGSEDTGRQRMDLRVGQDEGVWLAPYPEEGEGLDELLGEVEPEEWSAEMREGVGRLLRSRGYEGVPDAAGAMSTAHRLSDALPLSLLILHVESPALDILEQLSLRPPPRTRTSKRKGAPVVQPVVGIVPLSQEWVAVLADARWESWDGSFAAGEGEGVVRGFVEDVLEAVAALHSQHIVHLALSPSCLLISHAHTAVTRAISSPPPRRHLVLSASSFLSQSTQLDPLLANEQLEGALLELGSAEGNAWIAPEARRTGGAKEWDPKGVDAWAVGRLVEWIAIHRRAEEGGGKALSTAFKAAVEEIVADLTNEDATKRSRVRDALVRYYARLEEP